MTDTGASPPSPGSTAIVVERFRHPSLGHTLETDAAHEPGELTQAGIAYALAAVYILARDGLPGKPEDLWPWEDRVPGFTGDPARLLAKAGAMFAAEADQLDRRRRATLGAVDVVQVHPEAGPS